jgi:hypothetical protein
MSNVSVHSGFLYLHSAYALVLIPLQSTRLNSSLQALGTCYTSAVECLEIVVRDFAPVQMLVGQYSTYAVSPGF